MTSGERWKAALTLAGISACAMLLVAGGCQRADADYAACSGQVHDAVRDQPVQEPASQEVQRCMAARGWRALRPSLPPGSNAWARIR